ncbi:MAG: insulinase family protein [Candidatus Tectomicrobia bacterium]|uniref:Insulinase family protein n=1 Tax=Tectimicrobiota bacterium TaxID=2528274 RepID=A0A932CR80_UNCTE|nr:insulinase family protein [Candidatus Tectomicrobia bacterium]
MRSLAEQLHEVTLDNGLRVLLWEEHKAPVIALQLWYPVGSRNEDAQTSGASHLVEHMLFRGTPRYGPKAFSRLIQRNGANHNAYTTEDFTVYHETLAADRIEIALELEADRMVHALMAPQDYLVEREVVKEERCLQTEDDPVACLQESLHTAAFQVHPYRWPVIGTMESLEQLDRDQVDHHYRTHYQPNNALLVAVGDFQPDALLSSIREQFEPLPPGPPPPPVGLQEPPQQGEQRITLSKEAQLPFLMIGYHTPNLRDPDSIPLVVLEVALIGGKSSLLHRKLVYEEQLALYVEGEYARLSHDPHLFYFYVQLLPDRSPEEAERRLYQEIAQLQEAPLPEPELQKVKNKLEASFLMAQDSIDYRAMLLGRYEAVAGWRWLDRFLPEIQAVTATDVQRVARRYLTAENRTVAILLPSGR